jgi:hypothetical protein
MATFVEALKKWRHYLLDKHIVAQTDSKFVEQTNTQKATTGQLIRWWETFAEYNVEFQHIERQKNIVADALSRSLLKVFNEHVFFATAQPSNATQIPQTTRKDRNRDRSESTENQKVSHEHTFFVTTQPSNAKQILRNMDSQDTIISTRELNKNDKVSNEYVIFATTQSFDVKQIPDSREVVPKNNKTAPEDSRVALKVSNRHDFFATVLSSHVKQILSAFTAMKERRLAFDYSGDVEFGKM